MPTPKPIRKIAKKNSDVMKKKLVEYPGINKQKAKKMTKKHEKSVSKILKYK